MTTRRQYVQNQTPKKLKKPPKKLKKLSSLFGHPFNSHGSEKSDWKRQWNDGTVHKLTKGIHYHKVEKVNDYLRIRVRAKEIEKVIKIIQADHNTIFFQTFPCDKQDYTELTITIAKFILMNHNHSTPFCHRYHQMLENIIDANSITVRQLEKQYPKIANVLEKHLQTTLQKENIDYIKPLPLPHELPREEPYIKKTHRLRIAAKSGITGHLYLWQDEADHVIRTYEDSQDHPQ